MPRIIAVNGSPRKNNNTAALLGEALKGARARGAETSMVHLYDITYKGCTSCFACKRKGQAELGKCFMKDDLSRVLNDIMEADALILGSPIYLSDVTGAMRAFMERLCFPLVSYDSKERRSVRRKNMPSAFFYTMGVTAEQMAMLGYEALFKLVEFNMTLLGDKVERLVSLDAYQFDRYDDYAASNFDEPHKARVRAERLPNELGRAFEIGFDMARV